jgi:AraC-like DNA-binding protein
MRAVRESIRNSPGISFCFQERNEPLSFSWHRHPEYELTLIIEGTGKRFIGDDVTDFRSRDLVLIGPNVPHAYESAEAIGKGCCRSVILQFRPSLFSNADLQTNEFRSIQRFLRIAANGLEFDSESTARVLPLIEASVQHSGIEKLLDLIRVLDLLATGGRWRTIAADWNRDETSVAEHDGPRHDGEILQFVFAHADGPLTLAGLSGNTGMSVATLCRFFKKNVGCTFNEYLTRIRISQACKLLIQTNLPVYSVCFESGFENLSNFNRRFLRLKGMTPSAYRRLHRKAVRNDAKARISTLA